MLLVGVSNNILTIEIVTTVSWHFYSGSVSAISILTFRIVGVSLHPHDLVRGVGIIDSAALHELSLTQASVQVFSQHLLV